MPPVHRIVAPGNITTDVTDNARLYSIDVTAYAEEGSVANSTQVLDDPLGELEPTGHNNYRILEDTATGSNQYIWTGSMGRRTFKRGDSLRTTGSRQIEVELIDHNQLLSTHILTKSWANRPAETDVARVQAIVANNGAPNIDDTRFLSTANGYAMPANDYRGQTAYSMLDDCAQESGKNWFVWWAGDSEVYSLWYDFASSESYSSPLRLSNVLADVDETWTFALSQDAELVRDPSRVYSHIYLPWENGAAFVENLTTAVNFSTRHAPMDGYNVKTAAQAEARANRYLADASTEEDVLTTSCWLPAAKVNFLMQGMRVQVKALHLPGLSDFVWGRVLSRTVRQVSETHYEVRLDIGFGVPEASPVAVSCENDLNQPYGTVTDGGSTVGAATGGVYGPASDPELVNDGNDSSPSRSGWSSGYAGPPSEGRWKSDLGAARDVVGFVVITDWQNTTDPETPGTTAFEFSDNGSSWTSCPVTLVSKEIIAASNWKSTWSIDAGTISHRYWRLRLATDSSGGYHSLGFVYTWCIVGTGL